jgi:hypothetical protein
MEGEEVNRGGGKDEGRIKKAKLTAESGNGEAERS